jgi:hypothetical protein
MNSTANVQGSTPYLTDFSVVARIYSRQRVRRLQAQDATSMQAQTLKALIRRARTTSFGRAHGFDRLTDVSLYPKAVPVRDYEAFWDEWWGPDYPVLKDISWPGQIPFFALTSGTTTGRSKYIPYTRQMRRAAVRGFLDLLCFHFNQNPDSRLFGGAVLGLTGPTSLEETQPGVAAGAVSAITTAAAPFFLRNRILPPQELSMLKNWRDKIRQLAPLAIESDVRMLGGSPNWLLIFLTEVAGCVGGQKDRLANLFPNLELIVHGGVNFAPYRSRFRKLLQGSHAETRELYSASEGVFAYADRGDGEGLRLHLDGSVFFEFVPLDDVNAPQPRRFWIGNVETDVDYALAITTAAGLWSYLVGDVVRLISIAPPRLLVTGRMSQGLSAFGEHLLESEIAGALAEAAELTGSHVLEYTVGARRGEGGGRHIYFIETENPLDPLCQEKFAAAFDAQLSAVNEDYQELRRGDLAIGIPEVTFVAPGAFAAWMESRRALGGQNKVPRIVTDDALFKDLAGFFGTISERGTLR